MWLCEHRKDGTLSLADGLVIIKDYKIVSELSDAQTAKLHLLPRWKWVQQEEEQQAPAMEAKIEEAPKPRNGEGAPVKIKGKLKWRLSATEVLIQTT